MKDKNNNLLERFDYVYYVNANCTIPTQIEKIGKSRVLICDLNGKLKWVNPSNCEIQDDQDGKLIGKWNYVPKGATTTTLKQIKNAFIRNKAIPIFVFIKHIYRFIGTGYVKEGEARNEDYLKYPVVIS